MEQETLRNGAGDTAELSWRHSGMEPETWQLLRDFFGTSRGLLRDFMGTYLGLVWNLLGIYWRLLTDTLGTS